MEAKRKRKTLFALPGVVALLGVLVSAAPAGAAVFGGNLCFTFDPGSMLVRLHVKSLDPTTFVVTSPNAGTGIATKSGTSIGLNMNSNAIENGDRKSMFLRVNLNATTLNGSWWYNMLKNEGGAFSHSSGGGTLKLRTCP